MNKINLFFVTVVTIFLFHSLSFGQSIFFDDFDSYTAGEQLVCQNPIEWSTWSDLPCDPTEDPYISINHFYSGSNSCVILENNDLLRLHGERTTDKWYISFFVYIPAGKAGYFNTMSGFKPNPLQWAMEVYFDAGGSGRLQDVLGAPISFTWLEDTWQQVGVVVDLDTDNAEFWFGTSAPLPIVHTWQWSQGGIVNLQLDACDFFGATYNDEMYVDNYYFSAFPPIIIPVELTSFVANVNNLGEVVLNWITVTELNNQMFEIERRTVESKFHSVGYINGAGTTIEPQEYTYVDEAVQTGTYFYKLKQIDFDGRYNYSD